MAVVAVAAASIGASYHGAAATHSLRTTLAQAPVTSHGLQLTVISAKASPVLGDDMKSRAGVALQGFEQTFDQAVAEVEYRGITTGAAQVNISWRDGACDHLTMTSGRCASGFGEVVATPAAAAALRLKPGSRIPNRLLDFEGKPVPLTLVGTYTPKDTRETYWFGNSYFPSTDPTRAGRTDLDQLFTSQATADAVETNPGPEAYAVAGRILFPVRQDLDAGQITALGEAIRKVADYAERQPPGQVIFNSTLTDTLEDAQDADRTLSVPILVISLQLIVLCWLLLFFTVTDMAEARAPDIALVKLRGLTGIRLLAFGLAEQISLLILALPVGVLGGRAAVHAMTASLFGPGVPVEFPAIVWLTAGGAAAGGLVAAVLASRAVLTRPVTEQWRRTSRTPARRGWVPEAILLTLVAGGLFQIIGTGVLAGTGRQDAISLVVPGLLALGVALVGARLLPPACRLLFPYTRRHGGIALFLALRQIARRPGGARITVALATSFALVIFAVAAWSVARTNQREVARTQVGAPVALTVGQPPGESLTDFVNRADPTGTGATAVRITKPGDDDIPVTIAADPERFAAVAHWRSDFGPQPLGRLVSQLRVPTPAPVMLHGRRLRVNLDIAKMKPPPVDLLVSFTEPGKPVATERSLGPMKRPGRFRGTTRLPDCAKGCELRRFFIRYGLKGSAAVTGLIYVRSLEEEITPGRWRPIDAGLTDGDRWGHRDTNDTDVYETTVSALADGLKVDFYSAADLWLGFGPVTYPDKLKAIVTPGVGLSTPPIGLNGARMPFEPAFTARAIPGLSGPGVLVDEVQAHRSADSYAAHLVEQQIWMTKAAEPRIRAQLKAAGIRIIAERHADREAERLAQTGPGLALALMLAAAVATAILATAGAMLSLYAFARRRTYELAALSVAGAQRRVLRRSLLIEQAVILGVGTVLGVGTGLIVSFLALPAVPQFARVPIAPPLLQHPDGPLLSMVIAATLAAVAAGAWLMARRIMSRVTAELLREAPP